MYLVKGLFSRINNKFFLNILNILPNLLKDCKIIVYDRIYQRVRKVISPHSPYPALSRPEPLPDRTEYIPLYPFLKRNYIVWMEYKTYLLWDNLSTIDIVEHLQDDV